MLQEHVPSFHLDSSARAPAERFDLWRSGFRNTYTVDAPSGIRAEDFAYDVRFWRYGKMLLSSGKFGRRLQRRTCQNINADQVDHYRLVLQTEGHLHADADGTTRHVAPGEILLSDMSRVERHESEPGSNVVLYLARDLLDEALPRACDLHGFMPNNGASRILGHHLRALVSASPKVQLSEVENITRATVYMIAASVSPSSSGLDHSRPTLNHNLFRQICRYIDLHLGESDLCASSICAFFSVSRSALYRLFEPMDGVSHYVKERRLARIHEILAISSQKVHIGRLAEKFGFNQQTNFSRSFREQYGYSPREVAQRAVPCCEPSFSRKARADGSFDFDKWLRSLRD